MGETGRGRDIVGVIVWVGELFVSRVVLAGLDRVSGGVRTSCMAAAEAWAEVAGRIPSFDPASSSPAGLDPAVRCRISPTLDETAPCPVSVLFFPRVKMLFRPKRRLEDSDRRSLLRLVELWLLLLGTGMNETRLDFESPPAPPFPPILAIPAL